MIQNDPPFPPPEDAPAGIDVLQEQISSPPQKNAQAVSYKDHIRDLALALFDRTRPLHEMGEDARFTLEQAAGLLDIPLPDRGKKPGKLMQNDRLHGQIRSLAPSELSPGSQAVLATIILLQRGKIKKKAVSSLGLSTLQQRESVALAALLDIAVGLNASGSQQTQIQQLEINQRSIWLVVAGPQAVSDAAAAQRATRWWIQLGYPVIHILETSQADQWRAKSTTVGSPGVKPGDELAEAGRKIMRHYFSEMLSYEDGTILGEDPEELHNMRVTTRRLRAAFNLFESSFKPGALKSHLKGLRLTGRVLGTVRDLDVFIEKAYHYQASLPEEGRSGMEPLLSAWQEQRQQARERMLEYLESQQYATFKQKFSIFLNSLHAGVPEQKPDQPIPSTVRETLPILIYTAFARVRCFDDFITHAQIEQLHALRIEFKKLRYTVEFFQEVLGNQSALVIEDLKTLQDHLGELNDAQVATQILRKFLDDWELQQSTLPITERQNLESLANYLASRLAERHRLMTTFRETWRRFKRPGFRRNLAKAVSVL